MSYKAQTIARELVSRLRVRFAEVGLVISEGVDTNGDPTFQISDGTPATTEQNIFVRVKTFPSDNIWKNSVGLPQEQWTPHVVQVAMEAFAASGAGAQLSTVTATNQLMLFGEILPFKTRVEVYLSANGTVPSVSTIASANYKGGFDSLYFPLLATT